MKVEYEQVYHALEDDHWWFRGRRDLILRLLMHVPKDARIVEIGCSGGPLLAELSAHGFKNFWGVDISAEAIRACRARGIENLLVADGTTTALESGFFDVVISSDVLEHITDDQAALGEWYRLLRPGGMLVLFVPAHMFLWSPHDVANRHQRRYSRLELERKVRGAGFSLEQVSYWNTLLFFPIALVRFILQVLPYASHKSTGQLHGTNPFINGLLKRLLLLENAYLGSGRNFPFGVSLMVVAKK